jgi:hypothetical protein
VQQVLAVGFVRANDKSLRDIDFIDVFRCSPVIWLPWALESRQSLPLTQNEGFAPAGSFPNAA